jgi:preprotein translocase subunit SecG
MNRKGLSNQIILVIIMIAFLALVTVGFFIYSLIAPVITYTSDTVTNEILNIPNDELNTTTYLNYTFGTTNRLIQNAEWITYGLIFIMFITFTIFAYNVRTYPALLFIWIIMGFLLIFIAMALAESYDGIGNSGGYLQDAYESWEGNNIFLQNLPWFVGGTWLIGGIILFIVMTKDEQSELLL